MQVHTVLSENKCCVIKKFNVVNRSTRRTRRLKWSECQYSVSDCVWNVMAYVQKPDFVFRRNGRVHLNRRGLQSSPLLAAEVCASAVVMLDTPCSDVTWRVLATHSIRQFPLHFPFRASLVPSRFKWTLLFDELGLLVRVLNSSRRHLSCLSLYLYLSLICNAEIS